MTLRFEWDPAKAASNLLKHSVSFETAARLFADASALVEQDRTIDGEERWLAIGVVEDFLVLTVAHVFHEDDQGETIRIISARRAESQRKETL